MARSWDAPISRTSTGAGAVVLVVAAIGIAINLVVAWLSRTTHQNMNTRAALVNVMGDLLGSVAAVLAGAVIYFTGWVRAARSPTCR